MSKKRSKGKVLADIKLESDDDEMDVDGNLIAPLDQPVRAAAVNEVMEMVELVSEIFTYLPTSDIKSCNGVNCLWRQEARKLLIKRTRVQFVGPQLDTKILAYMEEMGDDCHESLSIGQLDSKNIVAEKMAITSLANKYGNKIQKFGVTLGNTEILQLFLHVTSLTVALDDHVTIPPDLIMEHVKTLGVMIFPKPPSPEFTRVYYSLKDGLTKSVLQMCPMVENLVLHESAQHTFIMALRVPDDVVRNLKITGFKFIGEDYSTTGIGRPSKWISTLPFNLTTLEIDNDEILPGLLPSPSTGLEEILYSFATTLKNLKLHRIPCINLREIPGIIKFPKMPNLESLAMTHRYNKERIIFREFVPLFKFNFDSGNAAAGSDIDYLEQFPVLQELSIKPVFDDTSEHPLQILRNKLISFTFYEMFSPEGTLPCPTLKHIAVDCSLFRINGGGNVWKLVERMANVFVNAAELKNFR